MIVDKFAGPGGWDVGLQMLGREDAIGIEWDEAACATREAAGLKTVEGDVAAISPEDFLGAEGLIASAPCPAFSQAGKRTGIGDIPKLLGLADAMGRKGGWMQPPVEGWEHPESPLVLQPLRWADYLRPAWIACEQVREVLPFWREAARCLEAWGYRCWAGILNAADYGVPQTRYRAFLLARLNGDRPQAPRATHFDPRKGGGLFGLPWVSMAEALGWSEGEVGFPRIDDRGTSEDGYRERDWRSTEEPAFALTEKARSWVLRTHQRPNSKQGDPEYQRREMERPAPALNNSIRSWGFERPATTVLGDPGIGRPGHKGRESGGESHFAVDSVKVSVREAAILQSFPPDYPWQGSKTAQFQQIGNAVPPLLAAVVLKQFVGRESE